MSAPGETLGWKLAAFLGGLVSSIAGILVTSQLHLK